MKYYISYSELTKTDTGIDNSIPAIASEWTTQNLEKLRVVLNMIRGFIRMPLYINSAYRNVEVNNAVNGAINSYHVRGRAADIRCENMLALKLVCKQLAEQGILIEYIPHDTYIHIAI